MGNYAGVNSLLDAYEKRNNTALNIGDAIRFNAILKKCEFAKTKAGKDYASVTFSNAAGSVGGKVWDTVEVSQLMTTDMKNKAVACDVVIGVYNGVVDLKVVHIAELVEGSYDKTELERSADTKAYAEKFMEYYNKLEDKWQKVVNHLFSTIPDGWNRFCVAYAASGYHDAQRSGLICHTVKMLNILDVMLKNDPRLESLRELLTVGVMIHDLGKVEEMNEGVYNKDAYINHRMRGIIYLTRVEQQVRQLIGDDNYNHLVSIVLEHHGGLQAEPMHTIYAMLIHMVDNCDAQFTNVADVLTGVTPAVSRGDNTGIKYNDTFLVI